MLLRPFLSEVILMFNLLLCLKQLYSDETSCYPSLHLSGIVLYSFTSLDLVISSPPIFYFSHSISLLLLLSRLFSFRSRFVHQRLPSPLATLFPYFSNLPEIAFFLGRDRLYHRFPFSGRFSFRSRTVYFVASTLKMLVRFNFLGTLLLPVFICFTPTAFYPQTCSISLILFEIFLFRFNVFPRGKSSSFSLLFGMRYIPFALSNHFSPDPLILSIYPFHYFFTFIYFIFTSSVLSFHSSSDVSFGAIKTTSRLYIYSFLIHFTAVLVIPFPYSISTTTTSICLQQICTILTYIYDESFYVLFSPLLCIIV